MTARTTTDHIVLADDEPVEFAATDRGVLRFGDDLVVMTSSGMPRAEAGAYWARVADAATRLAVAFGEPVAVEQRATMSRADCSCPDDCDCDGRFACEAPAGATGSRCELAVGHAGWHRSGGHRWAPSSYDTQPGYCTCPDVAACSDAAVRR